MLSDDGYRSWPTEKKETDEQAKASLADFKNLVRSRYVYQWKDSADLKDLIQNNFLKWIETNPMPGWIRAEIDSRRDGYAYQYVLNKMKSDEPHFSLPEDADELFARGTALDSARGVVGSINALINYYARSRLDRGVRMYFAYQLSKPLYLPETPESPAFTARYRIGIANTLEKPWGRGLYVGERSNIHRVYDGGGDHYIPDTHVATPAGENQEVAKEGSVYAVAVSYGRKSIGVIGLSSSRIGGISNDQIALGQQLSILFGALAYAFAIRIRARVSEQETVHQIRTQIADHFAEDLGDKVAIPFEQAAALEMKRV